MIEPLYLSIICLLAVGVYLLQAAWNRLPQQIAQWISKIVAGIAIVGTVLTVVILAGVDVAISVDIYGYNSLYFSLISTFIIMVAIWIYQRNKKE